VTPQKEICDSKDNDCDGSADEYVTQDCYSGAAGTKGVGQCKAGAQLCMHGKWQQCVGEILPASEICDNKDNDCDGTADDSVTRGCYTGASSTKGVGLCKEGTQTCTAGAWGSCAGEVTPATELCDNKDNDCNGTTDELVTQPCYTGASGTKNIGACKAGTQSCSAGAWGTCTGEVTPSSELCDNKDNDCDGATDEALNQACYTGSTGTQGVGACKAGTQFCSSGKWGSCNGEVTPSAELCDNKDNNCNGKSDEGLTKYCYSGPAKTKGVGLCKEGLQLCNGGAWGTCSGEVIPTAEKCDKKDNDCDGQTDEHVAQSCYTGPSATRGIGVCKDGSQSCGAGGVVGPCVGQVLPSAEKCDKKDNDCDGSTDESLSRGCYSGPSSTRGVGLCKDGLQSCSAGAWSACSGEVVPATEKCDSADNDCDGSTDESLSRACYSGASGTKGVGPCKGGSQNCSSGAWGSCSGEVIPATEKCDKVDNDCDGSTDESVFKTCYTGPSGTADKGVCRKGFQTCKAGSWGSSCAGQTLPSTETCDNKDNDCDGKVDENVYLSCYTGPLQNAGVGECKEGQRTCGSGTWGSCVGSVMPSPEVCDGKDNNCDKSTDEGGNALCGNGNACEGAGGCRCNGKTACTGGKYDRCCGSSYCQNLLAATGNCGACGVACASGETCNGGRCACGSVLGSVGGGPVCSGGTACCSNNCVNLSSDPKNCGQCGKSCPTGQCKNGGCVGSCGTNLAPSGGASSSGGGGGSYGPQRMNDNLGCGHDFHWVSAGSTPSGSWIQLVWTKLVQVQRLEIDTVYAYSAECNSSQTGRTAAGGTIQYWNGSAWITVGSVANRTNDWSFSFPSPVSTSRIRIYNIHATSVTGMKANPVILEWRIFAC